MKDKDILKALGLSSRTISVGIEEDVQIMVEDKIDRYLKKIDNDKKKQDTIDTLKKEHSAYLKKEEFLKYFNDTYVYRKIRNKLISDKFVNDCKFCWGIDVSGQYAKAKKPKHV